MENVSRLWAAVLGQTRRPLEWIICDNGSTDGTLEWLTARAASSPFPVRILSLQGRTIAAMLNEAIRVARHDVIACCHGGTRLPSDWLARLLEPIEDDRAADVAAGTWEAYGETPFERWSARTISAGHETLPFDRYLPASRSLAFTRDAWTRAREFPEWLPRFGEDTLFAIRLRDAGCRVVVVPGAKVGWRPKGTLLGSLRQHRLYTEADACMGLLGARPRLIAGPYSWLVACTFGAVGTGSVVLPALLLGAAILVDYGRLRRRTKIRRLSEYVFWAWLVAGAQLAGAVRGTWWRVSGSVTVPAADRQAIDSYRRGGAARVGLFGRGNGVAARRPTEVATAASSEMTGTPATTDRQEIAR